MIIAYADPPYIGQAKKHYSHDPHCAEVDHEQLIRELMKYDGWALSCLPITLREILNYSSCPKDVRIGAWVKPFASFKSGVNPAYAWEAVIFWGGRKRTKELPTLRDWIDANITFERGLVGAKPEKFCWWIFEMLGMQSADTLIDVFPGTNAVTIAFERWKRKINGELLDLPMFQEREP